MKLLLAGLLLVVSSASAFAAGPYIGVAGGVSIVHEADVQIPGLPTITAEYDTGYGFNASAGYDFDGPRVEGEFGYKAADLNQFTGPGGSASVSGVDTTFMSYMVNGYYDFKTQSPFTPYLGAGLGLINGEMNGNGDKSDDTVFGYQIIAGVGYAVNKNVTIDLSYRFQGAAEDLNIDGADVQYMSSNIYAGVRFNF